MVEFHWLSRNVWFCTTEWKLHRFISYEQFLLWNWIHGKEDLLKRLHRCWRGREQVELCKSRPKMKDPRRINLPIASAEVVFIHWKIWHRLVNDKWMKKLSNDRANLRRHWKIFRRSLNVPSCVAGSFQWTSVFFFEQNILDDDQGIENNWFPSGLTDGD